MRKNMVSERGGGANKNKKKKKKSFIARKAITIDLIQNKKVSADPGDTPERNI